MKASRAECGNVLNRQFEHFKSMWERIEEIYSCPIIQNNFEMPIYRILGNRDAWDYHGQVNFISRLNIMFYDYALNHENFYINDINYPEKHRCGARRYGARLAGRPPEDRQKRHRQGYSILSHGR